MNYITVALTILIGLTAAADAEEQTNGIPDSAWPAAWFKDLPPASERGIKTFHEAPMLSKRVKAGKLPPVSERLPKDPVVVEPFKKVGQYGGTLRVFKGGATRLIASEPPVSMGPQVSKIVLNYASSVTVTDACKTYIIKLRPGLRWSDGVPFTSADFLWYHKYIRMDKEITPVLPQRFIGLEVEAPDPLTVIYRFAKPYAFFLEELAHRGMSYVVPAHFEKRYHPSFRNREELEEEARSKGYLGWKAYRRAIKRDADGNLIMPPTMKAYQLVRDTPAMQIYERNPYYHKVDTVGNQLPYIDRVQVLMVESAQVEAAKASTGQVDLCTTIQCEDIPLFKVGEKANRYTTYMWNNLLGVDVLFQPNLTVENPPLRALFRDRRFRIALSCAMNRDEINNIIYFGHGTPRNTTVIPSSRYYEKEFATAYIKYDPEKANELLDEIGLKDVNGDGLREYPDGSPLTFTIEWRNSEGPKATTVELVVSQWRKVGINAGLKSVDDALQASRARSNAMEMTIWHMDRSTDILFPMLPNWFVPMYISWDDAHWCLWSHWYISGGERGEKPPPDIKRLMDWWDEMKMSNDPRERIELGKNILRSQAENVWSIGTVGLTPKPLIVSNRLRNVATRGYWGWDDLWLQPYYPATWYLEEMTK